MTTPDEIKHLFPKSADGHTIVPGMTLYHPHCAPQTVTSVFIGKGRGTPAVYINDEMDEIIHQQWYVEPSKNQKPFTARIEDLERRVAALEKMREIAGPPIFDPSDRSFVYHNPVVGEVRVKAKSPAMQAAQAETQATTRKTYEDYECSQGQEWFRLDYGGPGAAEARLTMPNYLFRDRSTRRFVTADEIRKAVEG